MTPPDRLRERAYGRFAQPAEVAITPETVTDLAKRYSHLVRIWARRYARMSSAVIDWEDLVSVGMMGLVTSYQRFDPSSGKPFETYAEFRIKGAMLDELRRIDPYSQQHRRSVRHAARAIEVLTNELGRRPAEDELAERLNVPIAHVREFLTQLDSGQHVPFEEADRRVLAHGLAVSGWSRADLELALAQSIATLDARSQTILSLYYIEGLSMAEISHVFSLTEARISQLHSAAIKTLREAVAAAAD